MSKYVMVIDQRRCVGCHTCAIACKSENNMPNGTAMTLNTVITEGSEYADMPRGRALTSSCSVDDFNRAGTNPTRLDFLTRSCQHCKDAPCVPVCPTAATTQREDGIVDVDTNLCISCGTCLTACPYDGMRVPLGYNPEFTSDYKNPYEEYIPSAPATQRFTSGSQYINQSRNQSVKKCTFCVHRLDNAALEPEERTPFCVLHCPGYARYFGDIEDTTSEVYQIISKAQSESRTIRSGVFPAKPGMDKPESSVYFIAHDL